MAEAPGVRQDVVVVGAGAAGPARAWDLAAAGLDVRLLEAEDTVDGRIRTDRVGGFTTDRGFRVFNTSYPQVRRRLDLASLRLRPFTPCVLVHTDAGRLRSADPTLRPRDGIGAVPAQLGPVRHGAAGASQPHQPGSARFGRPGGPRGRRRPGPGGRPVNRRGNSVRGPVPGRGGPGAGEPRPKRVRYFAGAFACRDPDQG
ncbi:NAD(P)-binding protein [Streptomyces sp. NPDC127110]|uniref:NAD(P)-binding protein n=1 Tax=Streptomyces sp. NPDC127110 TaxID=3345362 RepID=UPI0036386613